MLFSLLALALLLQTPAPQPAPPPEPAPGNGVVVVSTSFGDVTIEQLVHEAATVDESTPLNSLSDVLQKAKTAVLVDDRQHVNGVITMMDVIDFLAA